MTPTYILSDAELEAFNTDEGRAKLRNEIAASFLSSETVTILLPSLEPIDQLKGLIPDDSTEPGRELTSEEREAIAAESARVEAESLRLEEVIRPHCMARLRAEVRGEYRAKLIAQADEILLLRGKLAKFESAEKRDDNWLKSKLALTVAENARLKAKLAKTPEAKVSE